MDLIGKPPMTKHHLGVAIVVAVCSIGIGIKSNASDFEAGESLLKCSFNPGEAKMPNGQTFLTKGVSFSFISNFEKGSLKWKSDLLALQTDVKDTEVKAIHYEPNGNIFSFRINRLDGSAIHEFASPAGKNSNGDLTY